MKYFFFCLFVSNNYFKIVCNIYYCRNNNFYRQDHWIWKYKANSIFDTIEERSTWVRYFLSEKFMIRMAFKYFLGVCTQKKNMSPLNDLHDCFDDKTRGNRTQWRFAEAYQVCYKVCKIFISTCMINTDISSLLLWINVEAFQKTEGWFF